MHIFNYNFLSEDIPSNTVNLTNYLSELKVDFKYQKADNEVLFGKLEKVAKIQSIKSSNAIEGIVTSDERIEAIVNRSNAPLNHDEQEIAGYRDALNYVHQHKDEMQFDEKTILHLHSLLLGVSGAADAGSYKTQDNVIVEVAKDGTKRVRFAPTKANETKRAMEQLVLAYQVAISDSHISPLLLIPSVILDFLCIHPFRDGNGRMSRLLSLFLLYKAGIDIWKYVSFEEQINKYKAEYYEALRLSSTSWHENESDYYPFINNFLVSLMMSYKELDKRFLIVHGQKVSKKERVTKALLNCLTPISKSELCELLPDVSPTTIEAVLTKLVKSGKVRKVGSYRNARYIHD